MLRSILLLLFSGAVLSAQVGMPGVGLVRYDDGSVRSVHGIEASFVLGKPIAVSVDAASFSDEGGIVSVKGILRVLRKDGSQVAAFESGESHPVLYVADDLSAAAAWLPSRQSIMYWNGSAFTTTAPVIALPGQVTSLRLVGHTAELLTVNETTVSVVAISLDSGNELSDCLLPGIAGPAIQFENYVLYHDEAGFEIASGGLRRTVPLPASDLTVEQMASSWLHLHSALTKRHWALHITATELQLSELPGRAANPIVGGDK